MVRVNTLAIAILGGAAVATAFSLSMTGAFTNNSNNSAAATSRRDFLAKSAATAAVVSTLPKAAFADDADGADPYADYITTESGMKYLVTKEGDGAIPSAGQTVKAHYTGKNGSTRIIICI